MEEFGNVGHHTPLIRHLHVAEVFHFEESLRCKLYTDDLLQMAYRYSQLLLCNTQCPLRITSYIRLV